MEFVPKCLIFFFFCWKIENGVRMSLQNWNCWWKKARVRHAFQSLHSNWNRCILNLFIRKHLQPELMPGPFSFIGRCQFCSARRIRLKKVLFFCLVHRQNENIFFVHLPFFQPFRLINDYPMHTRTKCKLHHLPTDQFLVLQEW